jgi:hypothetical protein
MPRCPECGDGTVAGERCAKCRASAGFPRLEDAVEEVTE